MEIEEAVEHTLAAVAERDYGHGIVTRDRNDAIFAAAYGRAWRCLRSILQVAMRGEAHDAATLTRGLVSIMLRAAYIVQPQEPAERTKRLSQWVYTWRLSGAAMADERAALGFRDADPAFADDQRRLADEAKWAGRLPSDQDLAKALALDAFYSRVYREASDAAHFGLSTVISSFSEQPVSTSGEGAVVTLELQDFDRAQEMLTLALTTYGAFMVLAQPIVNHGLADLIEELLRGAIAAQEGSRRPAQPAG